MHVFELLETILMDVRAKDHEGVLDELSRRLLGELGGEEKTKTVCGLKDHESVEGVLRGTQSAIFHCLSEQVADVKAAIAISRKGIPHPGPRPSKKSSNVHIFFLLISPLKESGIHLQLLSKIEGLLLNRAFRHAVLASKTPEEIKKIVKMEEGGKRTFYVPLTKEEVFTELSTSPNGLTEAEARHRLKQVGPNVIRKIERLWLFKDFLSNLFLNLFALLLWTGGGLAYFAGMEELAWAIFLVIIINALFSFWQEYKAERAVEILQKLIPKKVRVTREGEVKEIDSSMLTPGDVIELSEGESIPADGRLVRAEALRVNNSALTGESKPIYKVSEPIENGKNFVWTDIPNLVFAGTSVLAGQGSMVVTSTGMDTEIGRIAYLTQAIRAEKSPLQKEMVKVTRTVTFIALTLGIIFFLLGYNIAGLTFIESFIFAIGIIVANVPEGLLPTVTLSLAMGVERMAKKKALVKKLSSVETLGSATVICTDKTGTLTTNEMQAIRLYVNNKLITVTGKGYEPKGEFLYMDKALDEEGGKNLEPLLKAGALCNNSTLHRPTPSNPSWTISGDPTEGSLVVISEKAGLRLDALLRENPRSSHLPFDRIRKRMTTIHASHDVKTAYVKGAPRETLELCSNICTDGEILELTERERGKILSTVDALAKTGLRILALAYRNIEEDIPYTAEDVEKTLTFIGLVAMLDSPRPEVKGAVRECHNAKIRIIMITGDYGLTAKTIAREVGIGDDSTRVVTGAELSVIGHRELMDIVKKDVLFARVAPQDKLRIVSALQDNGEVVAVTGDGVNDAPALKKADIGIAMGIRGSDVAKEAAEIILADDNFSTIVDAVREGRAIYANIKKFITYIFASNIPEIVPFIAFVVFKIPLPLTVMQILAVDLGTDVFPALSLGIEPPEKGIMNEPPRPRHKKLLDRKTLLRAYLFLGPIEAALCLGGFFLSYWIMGWRPGIEMPSEGNIYLAATTMSLAGIVACQIGNVFACRTEHESVFTVGLFKNRFVLFGIAAEMALLVMLVYTPFFQKIFGLAALTPTHWIILASFPVILLAMEEIRKLFVRKFMR